MRTKLNLFAVVSCVMLAFGGVSIAKIPSSDSSQKAKTSFYQQMPVKTNYAEPPSPSPLWDQNITIDPIITGPRS